MRTAAVVLVSAALAMGQNAPPPAQTSAVCSCAGKPNCPCATAGAGRGTVTLDFGAAKPSPAPRQVLETAPSPTTRRTVSRRVYAKPKGKHGKEIEDNSVNTVVQVEQPPPAPPREPTAFEQYLMKKIVEAEEGPKEPLKVDLSETNAILSRQLEELGKQSEELRAQTEVQRSIRKWMIILGVANIAVEIPQTIHSIRSLQKFDGKKSGTISRDSTVKKPLRLMNTLSGHEARK